MFQRDEWILEEYKHRKKKNESYSLRAFARDLKISPAKLSNVFNAKSSFSFKSAKNILEQINFDTKKRMIILDNYRNHEELLKQKKKRVLDLLENSYYPVADVKYLDFETAKKLNFWEANYLYAKMAHIPKDITDRDQKKSWLYSNAIISKKLIDRILGLYLKYDLINSKLECLYISFDFHASTKEFSDLDFKTKFFETHYEFQDNLVDISSERYPYGRWDLANLSLESSFAIESLLRDFYASMSQLSFQETDKERRTYGHYLCLRTVHHLEAE